MSLPTDASRLSNAVDEIAQLRTAQWPDVAGEAFARRHLSPLQDLFDVYRRALERYEAEIEEALSRIS